MGQASSRAAGAEGLIFSHVIAFIAAQSRSRPHRTLPSQLQGLSLSDAGPSPCVQSAGSMTRTARPECHNFAHKAWAFSGHQIDADHGISKSKAECRRGGASIVVLFIHSQFES
jgi:hypothetical protein